MGGEEGAEEAGGEEGVEGGNEGVVVVVGAGREGGDVRRRWQRMDYTVVMVLTPFFSLRGLTVDEGIGQEKEKKKKKGKKTIICSFETKKGSL